MKKILLLLLLLPFWVKGQIITTVAGGGTGSGIGDGGPATAAKLSQPGCVIFDKIGNMYIGTPGNNRIRMVDTSGVIHTVAGNGSSGYSGDGGPATNAALDGSGSGSTYVVIDAKGSLIISDGDNIRVRKVDATTGIIQTIIGYGVAGFGGDGGPATGAKLNMPGHIALDPVGNLFITDMLNNRIRKVDTNGIITTFAGYGGTPGYMGDGGQATAATFQGLQGLACDVNGNLYVADRDCGRVRKINALTGIISTIAGSGIISYSGDGIPATSAAMFPQELAFDASGELYISDYMNSRIYKVNASGILYSIAGNGVFGYVGDGMLADSTEFKDVWGLTFDHCGNLFIADDNNERVRKITFHTSCTSTAGVSDVKQTKNICIFPNPAQNEITINSTDKISSIVITNLVGKDVFRHAYEEPEQVTIDIAHLAAGMYFVKAMCADGRFYVERVVKE